MKPLTVRATPRVSRAERDRLMRLAGQQTTMSEWESAIKDRAVVFNVIGYIPQSTSRVYVSANTIEAAQDVADDLLVENDHMRSVMIYAIDKDDHHALVCYKKRFDMSEWKYA